MRLIADKGDVSRMDIEPSLAISKQIALKLLMSCLWKGKSKNRTFDMSAVLALQARDYVIQTFMPDLSGKDYIIGYRTDDSYFSFAEDFVSGVLSLHDLSEAMRPGALEE